MTSESQARRHAIRKGLLAKKSRWRRDSIDNRGGFQLIDSSTNLVVGGLQFDLSPDDVIEQCDLLQPEQHG